MINVKINGIPVQLERPMNVIEAAKKVGIHVPHFCYHKELTIHAGCRICMVEIKGRPKLVAGCATAVSDGMEIITESEKITRERRGILELQLTHHPLDCPVCDKGGECHLQDYTFKYGADRSRFIEKKREIPVNYNNPLLERNMERCVNCKRCVRICAEIQGDHVLSDMHRGSRTTMESFMGNEEDCVTPLSLRRKKGWKQPLPSKKLKIRPISFPKILRPRLLSKRRPRSRPKPPKSSLRPP